MNILNKPLSSGLILLALCFSLPPLSLSFCLSTDSTASIIARRRRFNRLSQELYTLPIVVWDGGEPSLSGTSTLTLRVCPCQRGSRVKVCQSEAFLSSAGLSTGALIAILLCVLILLGECGGVGYSGLALAC